MADDLWRMGLVETAAAIRERRLTSAAIVASHLARMRAVNPAINAIVDDMGATALLEAEQADREIVAGNDLAPLHGVPITIKENVDFAGKSAPSGVPAFKDTIAETDSPVVANLRRAGAIVIGRTNSPEFSLRWFTDNPLHGLTLNPWNSELTPGGSGGGGSASLAAGIGVLAHGNDLGGSLRYPAYCCGLATIKPSQGRIPAYSSVAPEERPVGTLLMSTQGPITRSVGDLRLALSTMAAPDLRDPWHTAHPVAETASADCPPVAVSLGGAGPTDPVVETALRTAADHLAAAGHRVQWIDPPQLTEITQGWIDLLSVEAREAILPLAREHGSADINRVLDNYIANAQALDLRGYLRALAGRTGHQRAWAQFMDDFPLVLMPVSKQRPFPQGADTISPARTAELLAAQAPMYTINYLGLPAAAVPTGVVEGLPTGVQVIGRRFREDQCIDAAERIEAAAGPVLPTLWARG